MIYGSSEPTSSVSSIHLKLLTATLIGGGVISMLGGICSSSGCVLSAVEPSAGEPGRRRSRRRPGAGLSRVGGQVGGQPGPIPHRGRHLLAHRLPWGVPPVSHVS